MPPRSAAVAQMELTLRIRARRQQLGQSIRDVSSQLQFSSNYFSAVENGRALLATDKLTKLCEVLELDARETDELLALREIAREPRWTSEYSQLLTNDELALYIGLEYGATKINTFEGLIAPGLLQCDNYAVTLFRDDPATPGIRQQKHLELRRRRQQRLLADDDALILHVLLGETVLMQQIGGPAVLREQIVHMLDLIERLSATLTVRIIPFTVSPRGMVNSTTLHLLEFDSPHLPMLAWREGITPIGISDDPDLIDILLTNYDRGTASALSAYESVALMEARVKELERP
ncbi:MAG: helix-turn-helix transcriptional regulator [Acidimicrobiales bacterium]